jgi:hypothetical protein
MDENIKRILKGIWPLFVAACFMVFIADCSDPTGLFSGEGRTDADTTDTSAAANKGAAIFYFQNPFASLNFEIDGVDMTYMPGFPVYLLGGIHEYKFTDENSTVWEGMFFVKRDTFITVEISGTGFDKDRESDYGQVTFYHEGFLSSGYNVSVDGMNIGRITWGIYDFTTDCGTVKNEFVLTSQFPSGYHTWTASHSLYPKSGTLNISPGSCILIDLKEQ